MTDLVDLRGYGKAKYIFARKPSESESNAQLKDVFVNTSTGVHYVCIDATPAAQQWLGTDGTTAPIAILSINHPALQAMWTMDNINGSTLVDESTHGRDAVITNTIFNAGKIGNAAQGGAGRHMEAGVFNASTSSGFAISLWFKHSAADVDTLIQQYYTTTNQRAFWITANSDGTLLTAVSGDGTGTQNTILSTTGTYDDGLWHHLIYQVDSTNVNITIDENVEIVSTTTGFSMPFFNSDSPVMLMSRETRDSYDLEFTGLIDQVRMFNNTFTAQNITDLFEEGAP